MKSPSLLAACVIGSALLAFQVAHAQEKAGVVVAAEVEAVVTVVDVDREARMVTLKGPKGNLAVVSVPPEAQNLDQVHPGARFKVKYLRSVVLALSKGNDSVTATSSTGKSVNLAAKGDTPGGTIVRTIQSNAAVEKIDREGRIVTVRGAEGGPLDLYADETVKAFDQVEVGDVVTVQYTEGLAMRMIRE